MIETFFHGGELNQECGFAFWARTPGRAVYYSDGESLFVVTINLNEIVEDGIEVCDVADLENDEILEQQYSRIAELLSEGAEAVGCDDGIAIPHAATKGAKKVSIDEAYEIYETNESCDWGEDNEEQKKFKQAQKEIAAVATGAPRCIKNPAEAVQLEAVNQNANAIQHIQNPSEAVQLAAVSRNGYVINYINTPSEAVQLAAVQQADEAIRCIKTPSDDVLATHLIYHPRSERTPKAVLDRAEKILDAHCPGMGDVWVVGMSLNMSDDELKNSMITYKDKWTKVSETITTGAQQEQTEKSDLSAIKTACRAADEQIRQEQHGSGRGR